MWKTLKVPGERITHLSHSRTGSISSNIHHPINVDQTASIMDQYAVLVSCRCNYTGIYLIYLFLVLLLPEYFRKFPWCLLFCVTSSFRYIFVFLESRLFFKQPTSWRPHISRDVLISVASEMSKQTLVSNGRVPQLPVQVLGYIVFAHMLIYLILCCSDSVRSVRHHTHSIVKLDMLHNLLLFYPLFPSFNKGGKHMWIGSKIT